MRIACLIFLAVMSIVLVSDCKPLSDDAKLENGPCVDCEQKHMRRKRCLGLLRLFFGPYVSSRYKQREYRRPNVYVGNGNYNSNRVVINQAHNVYIGNGRYNDNYVSYG